MIFETEGIVLRDVKLTDGRRLLSVFSKSHGKITAGTSLNDRGKGKAQLSIKPFNLSKYQIYKKRENYFINSGDVIKSYYNIGNDVDKYMNASYVIEFTSKILMENEPQQKIFNLLTDFLQEIERRKKKHATLVIAYEIKVLKELGYMPNTQECVMCGASENLRYFLSSEGGSICEKCKSQIEVQDDKTALIEYGNLGIIDIISYFISAPMSAFSKVALDDDRVEIMRNVMDNFIKHHVGVEDIKSREFLSKE